MASLCAQINKKIKYGVVLTALAASLLWVPGTLAATANLHFSPSMGEFEPESTFTINASIVSPDEPINAVSGKITFPGELLEIVQITKNNSFLTFWLREPTITNQTISWEGVSLTPGKDKRGGPFLSITFRTKKPGSAIVSFAEASVLANDGAGTAITTALGQARFTIVNPVDVTENMESVSSSGSRISAPLLASPTHPDKSTWYRDKRVELKWSLPNFIIKTLKLDVDQNPNTIPKKRFIPAARSADVSELSDGIWYFHGQFEGTGVSGPVAHYRVQIDRTKPENFNIQEVARKNKWEPRVPFIFNALDETSGIDRYEVTIDDSETTTWEEKEGQKYTTPPLSPGNHMLLATAVDRAGNSLSQGAFFAIDWAPPPTIKNAPERIAEGQRFRVNGTAAPKNPVVLTVSGEDNLEKEITVTSDNRGRFTIVFPQILDKGMYTWSLQSGSLSHGLSRPSLQMLLVEPWYKRILTPTFIVTESLVVFGIIWVFHTLLQRKKN